jgi:hypothetical protein
MRAPGPKPEERVPPGGGVDAAAAVRLLLGAQPPALLAPARFVPLALPTEPGPSPVVAVDGSHAVLADNGAVWVVATRCAATPWPGPSSPAEPELHAAPAASAQAQVDAAYARHGLEPPRTATALAWAEAWRALREHEAALRAIAAAPAGTLLLVDGALTGMPPLPQAMADRIQTTALRHGLRIVGVSKRSALSAVVPLHAAGQSGPWHVEVEPGVHVARLHALAPHAFRVDAQDPAWVATLVPLARDAAYVGYPYPLAVAHNRVALTGGAVAELKARLAMVARSEAGPAAARLLADFHETLDRNVPG